MKPNFRTYTSEQMTEGRDPKSPLHKEILDEAQARREWLLNLLKTELPHDGLSGFASCSSVFEYIAKTLEMNPEDMVKAVVYELRVALRSSSLDIGLLDANTMPSPMKPSVKES